MAHWRYPMEAARQRQSGRAVIEFAVRRDGTVRSVKVLRSTGSDLLDRYAVDAINVNSASAPFRVPDSVGAECLVITATFTYELNR